VTELQYQPKPLFKIFIDGRNTLNGPFKTQAEAERHLAQLKAYAEVMAMSNPRYVGAREDLERAEIKVDAA
jgi:hypothetical protein